MTEAESLLGWATGGRFAATALLEDADATEGPATASEVSDEGGSDGRGGALGSAASTPADINGRVLWSSGSVDAEVLGSEADAC